MPTLTWFLILSDAYPLGCAWQANRSTSLFQAVNWALAAWIAWLWAAFPLENKTETGEEIYLALCLTACTMVAVLGARRPGVGAWNFVVGGLLAVMLLPVAESLVSGTALHLETPRTWLLGATLAIGILNYLPTRLAPAAISLGLGCAGELLVLGGSESLVQHWEAAIPAGRLLLALAPWMAWVQMRWQPVPAAEFDRLWLDYRNRYGLVWGQRLREQFNRSAAHAGWAVYLRWQGLRLTSSPLPEPATQAAILNVLRALLKRFGPEEKKS